MAAETKQGQKCLMMTPCQQIVTSFLFLQFTANLEESGSQIE